MSEFFRSWRRKLGCVSLLAALAFTVGWTRSATQADFIGAVWDDSSHVVVSFNGLLNFQKSVELSDEMPTASGTDEARSKTIVAVAVPLTAQSRNLFWGTLRLQWFHKGIGLRVPNFDVIWRQYDVEWKWEFGRFQYMAANDGSRRVVKAVIPYWPFTISLTLLSVSLLLSKSGRLPTRVSESKPVDWDR